MQTRKITVSGIISAVDDNSGDDEHGDTSVSGVAHVSNYLPSGLVKTSFSVGDEVRVELELHASIADNNFVRIQGVSKLFEGTSADTDDLEDDEVIDLQIAPDIQTEYKIHLVNSGLGGGDTADIVLNLTNTERAPRRIMPPTVKLADQELAIRRGKLLRAWARNFRDKHNRELLPWQLAIAPDHQTAWIAQDGSVQDAFSGILTSDRTFLLPVPLDGRGFPVVDQLPRVLPGPLPTTGLSLPPRTRSHDGN
jgi:hypothetical protein